MHPTKCLERVLKYSFLVSIILNYQFPKTIFSDFFVLISDFNSISSLFNNYHLLLLIAPRSCTGCTISVHYVSIPLPKSAEWTLFERWAAYHLSIFSIILGKSFCRLPQGINRISATNFKFFLKIEIKMLWMFGYERIYKKLFCKGIRKYLSIFSNYLFEIICLNNRCFYLSKSSISDLSLKTWKRTCIKPLPQLNVLFMKRKE